MRETAISIDAMLDHSDEQISLMIPATFGVEIETPEFSDEVGSASAHMISATLHGKTWPRSFWIAFIGLSAVEAAEERAIETAKFEGTI